MATISGPRYPTGSSPYTDIMFYDVARDELPPVANSGEPDHYLALDFTLLGKALRYKIIPQCVMEPDHRVRYYIAYHVEREHNEFAIGPGKLDTFATFVERYAIAAGNFYGFTGSVTKHEVNYIKFQNKLFNGQLGAALKVLKQSWLDALQDPNWVCQTLLAHGALVGGAKKLPGKKGPAIVSAVEEAERAGTMAKTSGTSGAVKIGEYGGADALRAAINVSAMDEVTYSVQSISAVSETGSPSVAKAAHRELIRQSADAAKAAGKKSFFMVGEQANPNFVRHADQLAEKVGVPGSGKAIGGGGPGYKNYRVELLVDKVLEAAKTDLLGRILGLAAEGAPQEKR